MWSSSRRHRRTAAALFVLGLLLTGCRQDMHDQPTLTALEGSDFFTDGIGSRPPVPDTVARGQLREDKHLYTGRGPDEKFVTTFPFAIDAAMLDRGQERFNVFCSPCHGRIGEGNGMVVRRGFRRPPTLHSDRLREAPVGYLFDVISNGFGAMPDYGPQIPVRDRWRILAYLRALQLSQHATIEDVPAPDRTRLATRGD